VKLTTDIWRKSIAIFIHLNSYEYLGAKTSSGKWIADYNGRVDAIEIDIAKRNKDKVLFKWVLARHLL
jgi:hypothetical protein